MKAKIKKIHVSTLINILIEVEKFGIEYVDIEVKHISDDLDKIKIMAYEQDFAQESQKTKLDEGNINDIIAWQ